MANPIEATCSNCNHSIYDEVWGEYKCTKKSRVCTESEVKMGCSSWEKDGTKKDDPKPELVVRSGATFTPHVSDTGVLSWTNDKGLANPKQVNIKGPKGDPGAPGEPGKDGKDGAPGAPGAPGKDGLDGKNGYTPVKGVDYFDGEPGKDGFSPVVEVEAIDGGHRVSVTDSKGTSEFNVMDGEDGVGGGGAAIIDVVELPTENVREDVFYRLLTVVPLYNQYKHNHWTCYCVEVLPETGEPVTTDMVGVTIYYTIYDGKAYGYINAALSSMAGIPVGWYTLETLGPAFGMTYSGVITSIEDDPCDGAYRLLLDYTTYSYKDTWTSLESVGRAGIGVGAETFNHPSNVASGDASHAEGYNTTASGYYSHAEGDSTTASGGISHAEGWNTTASGFSSHAEGYSTTASGDYSHAEGYNTTASGDYSHAEGIDTLASVTGSHAEGSNTIAAGEYQHVQGCYNVRDNDGKYAHIVGNGNSTARSNAHTLDWSGNAWFAGSVEGTALILKSPNGSRFKITVDDNGTLNTEKIAD